MAQSKIVLNGARDIPLNKLILSQKNVRRIKNGQTIEQLAEDIANRKLIQSLNVRPVLDAEGQETGVFEVPAGGRRLLALQHLAKTKRLAKNAPVPCIVTTDGSAEEDSLAENVHREALHPLDQFKAFKTLVDAGATEEEIAARFFVSSLIVKQRLKLASVSPKLLDLYAAGDMTLDQLTAFSVSPDHAHQEQVWDTVQRGWNKAAYYIKQLLTQNQVPADDRRAMFVGPTAYEAAGGVILRDLFAQHERGGWFKDPALLDRLASEKLQAVAAEVMADGWQWVDVALSHPYGHTSGLHRLSPTEVVLTEEESARWEALRAEYEQLQADHEGGGDLPEDVDARLAEIEQEIEALDERRAVFTPEAKAIGGVFISIGHEGVLKIERGFVRREDMPALSSTQDDAESSDIIAEAFGPGVEGATFTVGGAPEAEFEEEDPDRPISDRLMLELTTVHTLALRGALADDPDAAFVAVLHAMVLKVFYNAYTINTCLEIQTRTSSPDRSIDGLAEFAPAAAILCRKEAWAEQLPRQPKALWDYVVGLDGDSRASLFALCAGLSVNAMQEFHNRRPDAIAHGRRLAEFVGLDMAQHWEPTAANFFSQVTKGRILNAIREAKGEASAQLIEHLKKADMAKEAERLVAGSGWLPQPLRTPGRDRAVLPIADGAMPEPEASASASSASVPVAPGAEALPAVLAGGDEPGGEGSAPELEKAFANAAFDPGPDLDTFEEGLEPDAKAVALARAGQALNDDHFGIAAE